MFAFVSAAYALCQVACNPVCQRVSKNLLVWFHSCRIAQKNASRSRRCALDVTNGRTPTAPCPVSRQAWDWSNGWSSQTRCRLDLGRWHIQHSRHHIWQICDLSPFLPASDTRRAHRLLVCWSDAYSSDIPACDPHIFPCHLHLLFPCRG